MANYLLSDMNRFFFTKENISDLICQNYFPDTIKKEKKNNAQPTLKKKETTNYYIPDENDSLFWIWILFKYGFSEYEMLRKNSVFEIEKTKKINFIPKVRESKELLKSLKIKLTDIESNLANDPKLTLSNLEIILLIEKYNFTYIDDKIYYENIRYPGNKTCIIKYMNKDEKYALFLKEEKLFEYKNKLYYVENLKKPIKSISSYKAVELRDICKKLNINIMKSATKFKTKKDLYKELTEIIL